MAAAQRSSIQDARMPAPILNKVDLVALLRKVISLHTQEGTKIELVVEEGPLFVQGDAQLLSRIFSNIILNSLQSAREGDPLSIEVSARRVDDYGMVQLSDNGTGISEELRDKVFIPHFTTKKTGSGLGLAIARQGIEQSGGAIWFETEWMKGTSFFIRLPLHQSE